MSFEEFQDGCHGGHLGYGQKDFSNSESLYRSDASHQVSSQSEGLGGDEFEEFQDGHHSSHLGYQNGMILAILYLYVTPMLTIKFLLNLTYGLIGDEFEEFQDGHSSSHLGYLKGMILTILNLYIFSVPTIKFLLNPTYGLGGDVV